MASSLSSLALDRLCRTYCQRFVPTNVFPLPSLAQEILLDDSRRVDLPASVASALIEELARRGKLTANLLDFLVTPERFALSSLCLNYVRSVNEPKFVDSVSKLETLAKIDVSFSSCVLTLPRPLLKLISGSCTKTLTFFAANHVGVNVGFDVLPLFVNLKHLDVGFTMISYPVLRELISALVNLEYLDVSGNDLSWYEVFSLSPLARLNHLGMSSLPFLRKREQTSVYRRAFQVKWITQYFRAQPLLTSLDLSLVKFISSRSKAAIDKAVNAILLSTPSLTRLEISVPTLTKTATLLQKARKLDSLLYLGHFGENDIDAVPPVLKASAQLKLNVAKASYSSKDAHFDCMFRDDLVLKSDEAFSVATERFVPQKTITFSSDDILWRFYYSGRPPFNSMVLTAFRRLQFDSTIQTSLAAKLLYWNQSIMFGPPDDDDSTRENARIWDQLVELIFQFASSSEANSLFRTAIIEFSVDLVDFVISRPPLFDLVFGFTLKEIDENDDGYAILSKFLLELPFEERQRQALDGKLLEKLCTKLASMNSSVREDLEDEDDDYDFVSWYERPCSELLSSLKLLCRGLPDVLTAFVSTPGAVDELASAVLIWAEYHVDDDDYDGESEYECEPDNDLKNDEGVFTGAMALLAYAAETAELRSLVLTPKVAEMLRTVVRKDSRFSCLMAYLAGLFFVDDTLRLPRGSGNKKALAKRIFDPILSLADDWQRNKCFCPRVFHYHWALPFLHQMANCERYPQVSAYGLWRLYLLGDRTTNVGYEYKLSFGEKGMCVPCLVKDSLYPDAVRRVDCLSRKYPYLLDCLHFAASMYVGHSEDAHDWSDTSSESLSHN